MSFLDQYQSILGIVGGLIGVASAVAVYFRGIIQQNEKMHDLQKSLDSMRLEQTEKLHKSEMELLTIKTQFNVFWSVIEKELPKVLLKPHRLDIDFFLAKMKEGRELSEEEKEAMKEKMLQALEEGIPDDMKLGYILIIARVESEKAVKKV